KRRTGVTVRAIILVVGVATFRYASEQAIQDAEGATLGWWLSLVAAATFAALAFLVARTRLASGINGGSSEVNQLSVENILPATSPLVLSLGTAPLWRGLLVSMNRGLPIILSLTAFTSPGLDSTFESDTTIILRGMAALSTGLLVYFVGKRLMADALTRDGR